MSCSCSLFLRFYNSFCMLNKVWWPIKLSYYCVSTLFSHTFMCKEVNSPYCMTKNSVSLTNLKNIIHCNLTAATYWLILVGKCLMIWRARIMPLKIIERKNETFPRIWRPVHIYPVLRIPVWKWLNFLDYWTVWGTLRIYWKV